MLNIKTNQITGSFIPKTLQDRGFLDFRGNIPSNGKKLDLLNLPDRDIVLPFGFMPTGAVTFIVNKGEDNQNLTDIIQWDSNYKPLAIQQTDEEGNKTILKTDKELEHYAQEKGFTGGVSKSAFAKAAAVILEPRTEEVIKLLEKQFPEADYYSSKYDYARPDGFRVGQFKHTYKLNVDTKNIDAINETIKVVLAFTPPDVKEKIITKMKEMAENERNILQKESMFTFAKTLEEKGVLSIQTKDFYLPFAPSTFNALAKSSENEDSPFAEYQRSVKDRLPKLANAIVFTEVAGTVMAHSPQIDNFALENQLFVENKSFEETTKYKENKENFINKVSTLKNLYFSIDKKRKTSQRDTEAMMEKAKGITSDVDREKFISDEKTKISETLTQALKSIDDNFESIKKDIAARLGEDIVKPFTLKVFKQETREDRATYNNILAKLALAEQKKAGLDYRSLIQKSNTDPDKLMAMRPVQRIPYRAAEKLRNKPHLVSLETLTLPTVYSEKADEWTEENPVRVLKEGQTLLMTTVVGKDFTQGIDLKFKTLQKIATSIKYLSTLTAEGYKQAEKDPISGEPIITIKTDTDERVRTITDILDKVHEGTEKTLLEAYKQLSMDLKEANLLEGSAKNKAVKEILKNESAIYAPIISAAKKTNIAKLYEAKKIAKLTRDIQGEVDKVAERIHDMNAGTSLLLTSLVKAVFKTKASDLKAKLSEIINQKGVPYEYMANEGLELDIINSLSSYKPTGKADEEAKLAAVIYPAIFKHSISQDTESISLAATGDEKRDYSKSQVVAKLYRKMIEMVHIHSQTKDSLIADGKETIIKKRGRELGKKEIQSIQADYGRDALMHYSTSGSMLRSITSVAKAATSGEIQSNQLYFINQSQPTKTTHLVAKTLEIGDKKIKYNALELKEHSTLLVGIGKAVSKFKEKLAQITPMISKIVSEKVKRGANIQGDALERGLRDMGEASEAFDSTEEEVVDSKIVEEVIAQEEKAATKEVTPVEIENSPLTKEEIEEQAIEDEIASLQELGGDQVIIEEIQENLDEEILELMGMKNEELFALDEIGGEFNEDIQHDLGADTGIYIPPMMK